MQYKKNKGLSENSDLNTGFTLIEIAISVMIMGLLSVAVLTSISLSRRQVALDRAAQDIVLLVRQAQARALAVKKSVGSGSGAFPGYGVDFNANTTAQSKEIILFPDSGSEPNIMESSEKDSANAVKYTITGPVSIKKLTKINSVPPNDDYMQFDIVYLRPDPTTTVSADPTKNQVPPPPTGDLDVGEYHVCLGTDDGTMSRIISIWTTGQVSLGGTGSGC